MKKLFLALVAVAAAVCASCGGSSEVKLFNGKDLSGWVLYVAPESGVKAEDVFSVENGLIKVQGVPFGYMRTERSFKNYRLHAEWRWVGEGTNSGIFQRVQEGDRVWPLAVECQLAAGQAGSVVCLNYYKVDGAVVNGEFGVKEKLAPSSEKPVGEWNEADIECVGNTFKFVINGVLQNEGVGQCSEGRIALQSEGGPIEFRNVTLTELP